MKATEFEQTGGLEDWRVAGDASTWFDAPSQTAGAVLVGRIAELVGDNHMPDVDLRAGGVRVRISADVSRLRFVQFGIDAVDVPAVQAFWTTVLGYRPDPRTNVSDIYDPRRLNPVIFFQRMDPSEEDRRRQRNRIHLDLVVPHDQAQSRIDVAVAAGGRILTEPTLGRCTITDPEGNELNLLTHL